MTSRNTFAAKMQASLDARMAAEKAYATGDIENGRKLMLKAHEATSAAAADAESDAA